MFLYHLVLPSRCSDIILHVNFPENTMFFHSWPVIFVEKSEISIVNEQQPNGLIYFNSIISRLNEIRNETCPRRVNLKVNAVQIANRVQGNVKKV